MDLTKAVALVAGGTRGAGRGIATELGAAGATVYVTGRSTRAGRSEMGRPETIEEAADLVTARGGASRCAATTPSRTRSAHWSSGSGVSRTGASTCSSTTSGAGTR